MYDVSLPDSSALPVAAPHSAPKGGRRPSVLVVDDDASICESVRDSLRGHCEVATAASGATAVELLRRGQFDLLLCDVLMPGIPGLEVVRFALDTHPGMAALMMSGLDDPGVADSAATLGAYGYVVKPFGANELLIQIRAALHRSRQELAAASKREALEGLLAERTTTLAFERRLNADGGEASDPVRDSPPGRDALTGLAGRRHFVEQLERTDSVRATVLVANVDGFRGLNARFGKIAADRALLRVAERLGACLDGITEPARTGGDEFAALWTGDAGDGEAVARRIVDAGAAPLQIAGDEMALTVSVGFACGDPRVRDLLRDAGVALYRAKRCGKGRWERFTHAIGNALSRRFELEADIELAVERREIYAMYQPLVTLPRGRVVGFEALARWDHRTRGPMPPVDFIALAEELGIVTEITRSMLDIALGQLARWQSRTSIPVAMSLNLSAKDLEYDGLVAMVIDALARYAVPAGAVVLELTEGVLVADEELARERLAELRSHGIAIAIDDFGTGNASLDCLRAFPFDMLKIPRAYANAVDRSSEEAALVQTLVRLAERDGLTVVAEGIERVGQWRALAAMGCDLAQGYHFARPLDAGAAERTIGKLLGSPGSRRA
jgi:diguanylate cyclase (GGDEF)-like protein